MRNRYNTIVCTTIARVCSSYEDADDAFLIANVKTVRWDPSRNIGTLAERDGQVGEEARG